MMEVLFSVGTGLAIFCFIELFLVDRAMEKLEKRIKELEDFNQKKEV